MGKRPIQTANPHTNKNASLENGKPTTRTHFFSITLTKIIKMVILNTGTDQKNEYLYTLPMGLKLD